MHVIILNICIRNHVILFSLYKIVHTYLLTKIILYLNFCSLNKYFVVN
jgi:hypothetical protein